MPRRCIQACLVTFAALASTGCAVAPEPPRAEAGQPAGVEALAYLPADAGVVAVVDTGRRLDAARPALERSGVWPHVERLVDELRPVRGNLLAIAAPEHVAALVAPDPARLDALVADRVRTGALAEAGTHAGARLLRAGRRVVAVRDGVLVAGRSAAAVTRALDRRDRGEGYAVDTLRDAISGLPASALVRVAVDPRPLLARGPRSLRSVPALGALEHLGLALEVGRGGATLHARAETEPGDLLAADLPLAPRGPAPLVSPSGRYPVALGLGDLPRAAAAVHRGAFAAMPAAVAAAELATIVVRGRRRLDPPRALLEALAGPATLLAGEHGVLLRAPLDDRAAAARAVGRISARLPRVLAAAGVEGVEMRPLAGFKAAVRGSDVLAVFDVFGGDLLVGDGAPGALRALAARPRRRVSGPLAVHLRGSVVRDHLGLDHVRDVRGSVRGGRRVTTARLRLRLR